MDINAINSAIISGIYTNDDLNSIANAIRFARAQLARQQARALRMGDSVRFTSRGNTFFGTIDRIKIKNATVKVGNLRYNVPLSMLEGV